MKVDVSVQLSVKARRTAEDVLAFIYLSRIKLAFAPARWCLETDCRGLLRQLQRCVSVSMDLWQTRSMKLQCLCTPYLLQV